MQPQQQGLLVYIIQGLLARFTDVFGLTTNFLTTSDKYRLATTLARDVAYPLAYLRLTTLGRSDTGFNPRSLYQHGVLSKTTDDGVVATRYPVVQTTLNFEFILLVADFYLLLEYCSTWVESDINGQLNFTLSYLGLDFDIKVAVDPELTVPEKDVAVDLPGVYEMTANVSVKGYILSKTNASLQPLVTTPSHATIIQEFTDGNT